MEHPDRYMQALGKHLPQCRHADFVDHRQPAQYVNAPIYPTHWPVLRMAIPWAIIAYCILAALIVFEPSTQNSAIEATFHASEILLRCFHRLAVDSEQIVSELIADWHSINASMDWVS